MKNILIVGSGGREHAIALKLKSSKGVGKIYAIPGNAGMSEICECIPYIYATDLVGICEFVKSKPDIYMTVVAPDDPLAMGLIDMLNELGFRAFGPKKDAAIIEASKNFSKEFMARHGIPTAEYASFTSFHRAVDYVETNNKFPIVVKADGLALGKGVTICNDLKEAEVALKAAMLDKAFGNAGNLVVIEEFLTGYEVSVLAFCDGKTVVPMVSAEDNKRVFDGERGPNTGGMGCISPSRMYTEKTAKLAYDKIFLPTAEGLVKENREFKGVIYFGLIVDNEGNPKVIEYNARFGDPETQVVLPRLKTDLLKIFDACIDGSLNKVAVEWSSDEAICVCLASRGYPASYDKGIKIEIGKMPAEVTVYHAGTKINDDNKLVTNGGRVLGVTAVSKNLKTAKDVAYKAIKNINFDGMHYRSDIGTKYCKL